MDFDHDQCLAITKEIIELTDSFGHFDLVKKLPSRTMKFEDEAVIFYKEDKLSSSRYHNRHLYITAYDHDVEWIRGLVDAGSLLNIMSFQHSRRWGSL